MVGRIVGITPSLNLKLCIWYTFGMAEAHAALEREFKYFTSILQGLLHDGLSGKYALVFGEKLIDTFSTEREAYEKGVASFGPDAVFLVQEIISDADVKPESVQFMLHVNL